MDLDWTSTEERPSTLVKKVYFGHQILKGKDNGEGLQQPGGGQQKKNPRPYTRPGMKFGRRQRSFALKRDCECLMRPMAR